MRKVWLIGLMLGVLLVSGLAPVASAQSTVSLMSADGCPAGPRPD
ncbi:MAG TPA: hypothetical protein VGK74_27060 [Symbiobacteriaceae bacterium]|jgi:hypothetical protein